MSRTSSRAGRRRGERRARGVRLRRVHSLQEVVTRFRLTPAARRDLSSIWDFAQENWDARQAETDVTEIRAAIERVADSPARGRACDDIRAGYRRYAIGSHLVFYVENGDGVDVIRILHQRMDPTRHL
ncbi:type II toxin-antitoxin system RelE/ParE family toxin [Leifsonia shinshuensis]